MRGHRRRFARIAPSTIGVALACALAASSAGAVTVKDVWMPAPAAPGTPTSFNVPGVHLKANLNLNQVGVIKVIGKRSAKNVMVIEPGTSGGGAYFVPLARSLVEKLPNWQIWAVERRENLLEDQTFLNKAKAGKATAAEVFHYYLGFLLENPRKKPHTNFVPSSAVGFAREWGMNVAVEDLHTVIESAKSLGGKVVLAGHSLGGSVVTAYATWDFGGKPGADGLSGLVYDDGGSGPASISKTKAEEDLHELSTHTPWLAFGGIGAPYLGLFSSLGAISTLLEPEGPSLAESFPLLPGDLKPHNEKDELIPVTNEAEFGFGVNVGTSPAALVAAQVHAGKGIEETAKEDGLFGWNGTGAISPIKRYAAMLAGAGVHGADGSEWYFPERLTIDTGAVADGNYNEAQEVLGEHAIFGHEIPASMKILAISTELDKLFGSSTLTAAEVLAEQSGIPKSNLTLINREDEYAHNDPNAADPNGEIEGNIFYKELVPFLEGVG